uniref:Uncharacterized protein n=1 Tax=Trichobilharzia regenti TaxID=157069 RepID=A0AA85J7B8_TRIRE|nr:unnamed protein product [Trichobilharzia regenti]
MSPLSNSQQHRVMNSFCTYENKRAEKSTRRHSKYTSSHTYSYHRRYIGERVSRRRRTLSYPSRCRPSPNYSLSKSHLNMKSSVYAPCPTRRSYLRTMSKHNVNNLSSQSSSSGGGSLFNEFVSWIHGLFSRPNSSQSAAPSTTTLSPYDIIDDTSESKLYNVDVKSTSSDRQHKRPYSAPIPNSRSYHNITRLEDNHDEDDTVNTTNTSEAGDDITTDFKDLTRNLSTLTHTPYSPASSASSSCLQFNKPPDTETSYYTPCDGMKVASSRTEVMVVVGLSVAELATTTITTAMNPPLSSPSVDHANTPPSTTPPTTTSKTNSLKSNEIMLTENNSVNGLPVDNCQSINSHPRKSQNISEFQHDHDDDDNEGDRCIRPDLTEIQSSVVVAAGNRETDKHLTANFQKPSVITNSSSDNFNKSKQKEISEVSVPLTSSSSSGKRLNQQRRIHQGDADDNTSSKSMSSNHLLRQQVNDSNVIFEISLRPELCALKGIAKHTDQALTEINDSVLFNKQLQYVNTQLPLQDKHSAIYVKSVKYISHDNVIHIDQDSATVYANGEQISQLIPEIQNPSPLNTHNGKQSLTGNLETSEQILSPTLNVEMNELHRSPLPGVVHYYDKHNNNTDHRILAGEDIAASHKLLEKRLSDIHHQGIVLDRVPPPATTTTTMMTTDEESRHSKLLCMNQFGEGILSGLSTSQLRLAGKCSSYESEKEHAGEEVSRDSLRKKINRLQQRKITIMPEQIYHCKSNIEMDQSINSSPPVTVNQNTTVTEKTKRNDPPDEEIYQHVTTPNRQANFSPEKIIYSPIDFKHHPCLLNKESITTTTVTSDDMHEAVLKCENDQNTITSPLLNTCESLELSELHKTDTKIQDVLVSQQLSSKYANSFPIPTQVEVDVVLGSTTMTMMIDSAKKDEAHHEEKKTENNKVMKGSLQIIINVIFH